MNTDKRKTRHAPIEQRLKARLVPTASGCLEWTGARDQGGYGRIWSAGLSLLTHRVAWAHENGPIPAGMHVLHRCDNPPCCNPDHLFIGTNADNMADKKAKGRSRGGVPPRKLSDDVEDVVRERYRGGETQQALAEEFGVSQMTVSNIVHRQKNKTRRPE